MTPPRGPVGLQPCSVPPLLSPISPIRTHHPLVAGSNRRQWESRNSAEGPRGPPPRTRTRIRGGGWRVRGEHIEATVPVPLRISPLVVCSNLIDLANGGKNILASLILPFV